MTGAREDPGDRSIEETIIGSENKSEKRAGGVVGPATEPDKSCRGWSSVKPSGECGERGGVLGVEQEISELSVVEVSRVDGEVIDGG